MPHFFSERHIDCTTAISSGRTLYKQDRRALAQGNRRGLHAFPRYAGNDRGVPSTNSQYTPIKGLPGVTPPYALRNPQRCVRIFAQQIGEAAIEEWSNRASRLGAIRSAHASEKIRPYLYRSSGQ